METRRKTLQDERESPTDQGGRIFNWALSPPKIVSSSFHRPRESHGHRAFWKGQNSISAVRDGLRISRSVRSKGAGTGRPERSPRESGDSPGSDGCTPWPAPAQTPAAPPRLPLPPQTCFPAWTLLTECSAPAQTLEGQSWGQSPPAPRSTPPACEQPGFPAAMSAPRLRLDPVLRLSDADGPRLPGCTGPGAARAGQGPPAFPRPTEAPPVRTSAPTLAARASTAGSPRRGPGYLHEQPRRTGCPHDESALPLPGNRAKPPSGPATSRAASAPRNAKNNWSSALCPRPAPGSSDVHSPTVNHRPLPNTPTAARMENDDCHQSARSRPIPCLGACPKPQGCPWDLAASPTDPHLWPGRKAHPILAAAARGPAPTARAAPTLARRSGRGWRGASGRRTWTTRPPCATRRRRS